MAKIVVHKKLYDRVELSINGVTAKRFPTFGEFHYVKHGLSLSVHAVPHDDIAGRGERRPLHDAVHRDISACADDHMNTGRGRKKRIL